MLFASLLLAMSAHRRIETALPETVNGLALLHPIQNLLGLDGGKTMSGNYEYLSYQSIIMTIWEGLILQTSGAATITLNFLLAVTGFLYFFGYLTLLL